MKWTCKKARSLGRQEARNANRTGGVLTSVRAERHEVFSFKSPFLTVFFVGRHNHIAARRFQKELRHLSNGGES